jgi:hypothetical protein
VFFLTPTRSTATPTLSRLEAEAIVGTLSKPSKMPCHSYSIPASACKIGSRLSKLPNSVCTGCYAKKGRYGFSSTQKALRKRLESLTHPRWTDAIVSLIGRTRSPYFRWHDSGDLQSLQHLMNIVSVAERLPTKQFWLPTREVGVVRSYLTAFGSFPSNLTVRVSAALVDGIPHREFPNTSTVVTAGETCPSPAQNNQCGTCRACWDPNVANVAYRKH